VQQNHLTRVRPLSVLLDILFNSLFMAIGFLIYYHFNIQMLAPLDLHPLIVSLFDSKQTAVLFVSGLPFVIGVFGIATTVYRLMKRVLMNGKN
jgi:hypothetical protein